MNHAANWKIGLLTGLLFVMIGCQGNDTGTSEPILIHASSSTQDALKEIVTAFQEKASLKNGGRYRPTAQVRINSAGSNTLATQILAGAPGDLFLSASTTWAKEVRNQAEISRSSPLLKGSLVLIAPKSFLKDKVSLPDDLLSQGKSIAVAGKGVPAGQYAREALEKLDLFHQLEKQLFLKQRLS